MKILLDPIYTLRKISGCSCYYKYKTVALRLLKEIDNLFIYFIVPEGNWELDDLIDDPRVKNIPVKQSNIRWNEYYKEPAEFWEKFSSFGEYGDWDVLITSRVPMIPVMRMEGRFTARTPNKFVIAMDDLPIMNFKKAIGMFDQTLQERMQIQGYLNSDLSFVFADFEKDKILESAKSYISFGELKKLYQKMKTGFFLLPDDEHIVKRKEDEFKVVYIQRVDKTERRPFEAFDSMKYFYVMNNKEDKKVVCDVYTNSMFGGSKKEEYSFINFYRLNRDEYHNKLKDSNVFVSFSIDEGFPLAVYEAIIFGSLGIIYKTNWSVSMLGDDYPFFFRTNAEALFMIKEVFKNWEKEYDKFLKWRSGLSLKYKDKEYFIDIVVSEIKKHWESLKGSVPRNNLANEIGIAYNQKGDTVDLKNIDESKVKIRKGIFAGFNEYRGAFNDFMHTRVNLLFKYGWKDKINKGEFEI